MDPKPPDRYQDTYQKALAINLDPLRYGTLAEIGGGQEAARWLFHVGGAAGTIAEAISAYDMTFSDSLYGAAHRYVSRERLRAMLDHEFGKLLERLSAARGAGTAFFVFADTVATRSYSHKDDGHGWLGIRFQAVPGAEPSRIDLHVNLHGKSPAQDQDTLGTLGVNLCHGAFFRHTDAEALLASLMDGLHPDQVEIDLIDFSGPAFAGVDNRLMALRLVQSGFTDAALFGPDGHAVPVGDALFHKAVLLERSRFRPPTRFNAALLEAARAEFLRDGGIGPGEVAVISQMTLQDLSDGGEIDAHDYLQRAGVLCALGKNVLISSHGAYYRLAQYLFRYTRQPVAVAMGLPALQAMLDEKQYADLGGGILEAFGRMFKHDLRLYVCPQLETATGRRTGVHELHVDGRLRHLYAYLLENRFIRALGSVDEASLAIHAEDVLSGIRSGRAGWEQLVPEAVARMIRERGLFGCPGG